MNVWIRIATITIVFAAVACSSPPELQWSKQAENLYSFSGELPDGAWEETPELELRVLMEVKRIRRRLDDSSKYGMAQKPNPPAPCRDWRFEVVFYQEEHTETIANVEAKSDEKGVLRVPLPIAVRELGSKGVGADVLVRAVLPKSGEGGRLYGTARESEPRVRFGGGFVKTIPADTLSGYWLRYGNRNL